MPSVACCTGCVIVTQSMRMRVSVLIWTLLSSLLLAQQPAEEYRVYTESPRLFLNARRARLLKRESERQSLRWQQFDALMAGKAEMPEPGFANALYYFVTGREEYGRKAVSFALSNTTDLRQQALVFDWCRPLLSRSDTEAFTARLVRGIEQSRQASDVPAVRSRVLAAVALADERPDLTEELMRWTVQEWWRKGAVPRLKAGDPPWRREDLYALLELMHAIQDNILIDLRESYPHYFRDLPMYHLLSYYPSPFPAAENEYRIPYFVEDGDPDLRVAALSRAMELSLVAYDNNAQEHQFVQGWVIQDRFLLRSAFGIPYEFLWANPYQPGLTPAHLPLSHHNPTQKHGLLLLRSSWEEDASWFGLIEKEMQYFRDGRRQRVDPKKVTEPVQIGPSTVYFGKAGLRFELDGETERAYLVGLRPNHAYDVEVDDEELAEHRTDAAGVLALEFAPDRRAGVRVRER